MFTIVYITSVVDMHPVTCDMNGEMICICQKTIQSKNTDLFLHYSHFIPSIQKTPFQTQLTTSATVCIIDNLSTHECGEGRSTLDKCKACLLKLFVEIMNKVNECCILLKDLLENLIQ